MANKTSKSAEGYFAKYKQSNKEASNRKLKLERQLRLQPGNAEQIELALKNIHHRRKTPVAPYWSHNMIAVAMLLKYFTGKFDKMVFSPDPLVSSTAAKARNPNLFTKQVATPKGSMFSIGQRAHDGQGLSVWQ